MNTAERIASANEVIAQFTDTLAQYDAALALRAHHIDGVNDAYLIRTSEGVYTKQEAGKVWGCGALFATRYTRAEAKRLAPTTRNGRGDVGVPVNVWEALATDRAAIAAQIETITKLRDELTAK